VVSSSCCECNLEWGYGLDEFRAAFITQASSDLFENESKALFCVLSGLGFGLVDTFGRRAFLCFATILSALKIARFPAATAVPSRKSKGRRQ